MPIRVLDKHVAELIAAGEVVERPSSVIKELVENSIDAGATHITVEIHDGGTSFMRITDDGCGIPYDQVPTAFLRHATSKVWTQDDLCEVGTLGFRGEALASVAAVARVEMLTAERDGEGTAYSICGGEQTAYDETGCPKGTTIIVRDLFYNVPARMKFLKKNSSEATAVAGVMDRMALSHPEISFKFINDGKTDMQTQGNGELSAAVYSVYGKEFRAGLIPVDASAGEISVKGFVCKPEAARKSRGMQCFYINGRYVSSNTMRAALEQAYKGSIMVGKFPSCVLFLTMRSSDVDVNVHPAKLECRFTYEKPVFDAVYYAVRNAINAGFSRTEIKLPEPAPVTAPAVTSVPSVSGTQLSMDTSAYRVPPAPVPPVSTFYKPSPAGSEPKARFSDRRLDVIVDDPTEKETKSEPVITEPEPTVVQADIVFIGEAFSTYAIAQCGDELIIVDKHAAHERIIYERLKGSGRLSSQMLIESVSVTLSKDEFNAVMENLDKINDTGFEIEEFGGSEVLVRAVPSPLTDCDVKGLITEIAAGFCEHKDEVTIDKLDWLYHNMACRAAVKGGDKSGREELTELVRRAVMSDDVRYCPHGRPVAYKLTKKELEKQFGRLG